MISDILFQYVNELMANPAQLLALLGSLISLNATFSISSKKIQYYKFKKHNSNMKIYVMPAEVIKKCNEFDEKDLASRYKDEIMRFYNILKDNFDDSVLNNFYNNIKGNEIKKVLFPRHVGGYYNIDSNIIGLKPMVHKYVLTHELLHLASTYNGNTGFMQNNSIGKETISIGACFDEGYTELLNKRYFYPESKSSNTYEYMLKITDCMEQIVGKDLMEECYFKADFYSVCEKMLEYIEDKKLESYIRKCEYIFDLFSKREVSTLFDRAYVKETLESINSDLINMYSNKLNAENTYSEENMKSFMSKLPNKFRSRGFIYNYNTQEFDDERAMTL